MNDRVHNEFLCLLNTRILNVVVNLTYQHLVSECVCVVTCILIANK
jgi:hypothetical protein